MLHARSQLCALAVPFTPLPYFLEHWPFGVVICHVLVCILTCLIHVHILVHVRERTLLELSAAHDARGGRLRVHADQHRHRHRPVRSSRFRPSPTLPSPPTRSIGQSSLELFAQTLCWLPNSPLLSRLTAYTSAVATAPTGMTNCVSTCARGCTLALDFRFAPTQLLYFLYTYIAVAQI